MTVELGVIKVMPQEYNRRKVINVYKDKEHIGEVVVNVTCPDVEEKIINLISIINKK